jgi:hypothetical protein
VEIGGLDDFPTPSKGNAEVIKHIGLTDIKMIVIKEEFLPS